MRAHVKPKRIRYPILTDEVFIISSRTLFLRDMWTYVYGFFGGIGVSAVILLLLYFRLKA
jgi:hypothetical protein